MRLEQWTLKLQRPLSRNRKDRIAPACMDAEVVDVPEVRSIEAEYIDDDEALLSMSDVERETIRKALERNRNVRRDAARELGISERTLYRKIKEYDLE